MFTILCMFTHSFWEQQKGANSFLFDNQLFSYALFGESIEDFCNDVLWVSY